MRQGHTGHVAVGVDVYVHPYVATRAEGRRGWIRRLLGFQNSRGLENLWRRRTVTRLRAHAAWKAREDADA